MLVKIIFLVSIASACFYIWVLVKIIGLRNMPMLTDAHTNTSPKDKVTVVIAARNEAESVTECLNSILNQKKVKEIVFIDDHSTDKTLELVKKVAHNNECIRILLAPSVPVGWTGKTHALNYGALDIVTKYILFTDADVLISPDTIDAAVDYMNKEKLDHLSGNFYIHCRLASESMCAPVLAASSAIALFDSANSRGSATGAFNMVRTAFYHRMGGHNQIKDAIVDDVRLARLVKSCGGRSMFVGLSDRASVRLFCGIRGFFALIARSTQSYLGSNIVLPLFGGLAIFVIGFLTLPGFFLALILYLTGFILYNDALTISVLLALSYISGLACCMGIRRFHNGKVLYALVYPLPLCLLGLSVLWSGISKLMGFKIRWRGRKYNTA